MARKIGILDDSATIRTAFQLTFAGEDLGVEPCLFSSADELLRSSEKLDLLYIDSKLGPQDGYQACSQVRAAPGYSAIPVVILYGPTEALDAGRASAVGAAGGVQKPWESEDMITRAQAFLSGSPPTAHPAAAMPVPARPAPPTAVPAAAPPARPLPPGAPVPPPQPGAPRIQTQIAIPGRPGAVGGPFPPIQATKPLAPVARPAAPLPPPAAAPVRPAPVPPARPVPVPPARPAPPQTRLGLAPVHGPAAAASPPAAPAAAPAAPPPKAAVVPVDLEQKLAAEVPGLSSEQLQAVLRVVSREIIEQVAWEVVPDLAETIIREQIQALLKE
ncbi:MAG: response regulator [Deltaproteobacteria bacterium]|nr:response regulator [Deltaproteobacteria bacterium]